MKIIFRFLFTLSIFYCGVLSATQVDVSGLVKKQENNDSNSRRETQLEKSDVYSNVGNDVISDLDLPKEAHCIKISKLIIKDNFLNTASIQKIKNDMAGRCIGVLGIERLAINLQDYFINSGYITTRVEAPEQDLSQGELMLMVFPGRIESIIVEGNDVRNWIFPFGKEDILNLRSIEQGLENLQKTPGVDVKVNVEPGSRNGYSNIMINTQRVKNWHARASFNNWGDRSTGQEMAGGAGYFYNMAKMSDIIYLSGTTSTTGDYRSVGAYYAFPLGFWDYEFFYSNSNSNQKIAISSLSLDYIGENEYFSAKGSRTLYRDKDKKISGSAELFRRKSDYRLDEIALELQKRDMGNIRLGVNYKQKFTGSEFDSSLYYQRFLTWFGGTQTPDMVSGEVKPASHIVSLDLNYTQFLSLLPFNAYYDIKFGGQYSLATLTLQDQLTLGNRWNVRGFERSEGIYGDKGFYLQNTLNIITGFNNVELYMGADYGQVKNDSSAGNNYINQKIVGATVGIKGGFKSLSYDTSLSAPLLYPDKLNVDPLNISFNVFYQL